MCFLIDEEAKPWTRKRVYKVVTRELRSPNNIMYAPLYYGVDRTVRALGKSASRLFVDGIKASAGIYVYSTLWAAAHDAHYSKWPGRYEIVELDVEPRHFLHQSTDGKRATYRQVVVRRVVPRKRVPTEIHK